MSLELVSYVVYGAIGLAWLVAELLGFYRKRTGAPVLTLSETWWKIEGRLPWFRVVTAIGGGLLVVHLASPGWP